MQNSQWYYQPQSIGEQETIGPISYSDFAQAVRSGVVKKKAMVNSPQATKGQWQYANAVPVVQKIWEQQRSEVEKKKQEVKQQRQAEKQRKATQRSQAGQKIQAQSSALRDKLLGSNDSPESFVKTCDAFIKGIRIICWLSVGLAVLVQIAMIAVTTMVAEDTVEALNAATSGGIIGFLLIGVQLVVAWILIEASVLTLRFMKMVVVLLSAKTA